MTPDIRKDLLIARIDNYTGIMRTTIFTMAAIAAKRMRFLCFVAAALAASSAGSTCCVITGAEGGRRSNKTSLAVW